MNSEGVLLRAREGDETAFRAIYERHCRFVYRLAFRYVGSPEDAEEVMQETFLKAFLKLHTCRGRDIDELLPWLGQICIRKAMNHLRDSRRRGQGSLLPLSHVLAEPEAHGASPEALAGISEAWNALDKAVAGLSRRQRLIFELRFGQGKDLKEIARLISSSESNVKTHLMRMLAKLRRHLAPIWTGI